METNNYWHFETDGISVSSLKDQDGSAVRVSVSIKQLPMYIKFVDPEKAKQLGQAIIEAAERCIDKNIPPTASLISAKQRNLTERELAIGMEIACNR